MTDLISIDPGWTTGLTMGYFDENKPYAEDDAIAIHDGPYGFGRWWSKSGMDEFHPLFTWVVESFELSMGNDFAAELPGVEIIGFLKVRGVKVNWQRRTEKWLFDDDALKKYGIYHTGEEVGHADGDDVNDAARHALVFMTTNISHEPTSARFWDM